VPVVEVDTVGTEPAEAGLRPLPDAGGEGAGLVGLLGRAGQELGGDHRLVAPGTEGGTEHLLRLPAAVGCI
jgi:hypothetical protein